MLPNNHQITPMNIFSSPIIKKYPTSDLSSSQIIKNQDPIIIRQNKVGVRDRYFLHFFVSFWSCRKCVIVLLERMSSNVFFPYQNYKIHSLSFPEPLEEKKAFPEHALKLKPILFLTNNLQNIPHQIFRHPKKWSNIPPTSQYQKNERIGDLHKMDTLSCQVSFRYETMVHRDRGQDVIECISSH